MRPTALLIPCPTKGQDDESKPLRYRLWFALYLTTRKARHLIGLHDWNRSPLHGKGRCTWCGKVPKSR